MAEGKKLIPSQLATSGSQEGGLSRLGDRNLPRKAKGLSLIELMIVLIVTVILTVIAVPSFKQFMQRYRLVTTIQSIYYNLQYARSEAVKRNATVYISFVTGSNWCYGISTGSACTCTTPSGCTLGTYTPTNSLTTLSLSSGFPSFNFQGSRGAASAAGTITLTVTGGSSSMGIDVGTLGNIQICSNTISGYPTC
jgi:type IV fimbrial biogenesis protein FimT